MIDMHLNPFCSYSCFGDQLDTIHAGKMMSMSNNNESIRFIHTSNAKHKIKFPLFNVLSKLLNLNCTLVEHCYEIKEHYSSSNFKCDYMTQEHKELILRNDFYQLPVETYDSFEPYLPEPYVTSQFITRNIHSYIKPEYIKAIKEHYISQGYELVGVGADANIADLQGTTNNIKHIAKVMSNAAFHIGRDSGMMHLAKLCIPVENIHVYVPNKFPNCTRQVQEMGYKGAKIASDGVLIDVS